MGRDDDAVALRRLATLEPGLRLDAAAVQRLLGLQSAYLAGLVVRHFDRDGDGAVAAGELVAGLDAVAGGDAMRRLKFSFELFDQDGDGLVDGGEFERLVAIGLAESGVSMGAAWVEATAASVFRDVDLDGDGRVTFGEFCVAVSRVEALRPSRAPGGDAAADAAVTWWGEHGRAAVVGALYGLVNVTAFAVAVAEYRARGASGLVQLARGAGRVLDVNLLLLLAPTFRTLLSALRRTRLARVIPLDDTLGMHRAMGHVVWGASLVHGLAHVANYRATHRGASVYWTTLPAATGVALLALGAALWAFALPAVRRSQRFELFWLAHRAYAPWLLLCVLHTPRTWPWLAAPLALLGLERALRRVRRAKALELAPLASGVTRVTVARPEGFDFHAGDYVYLRVPSLARGEWHPFTVSSAPEREGVFTVHVRSLGNWTRALHELAATRARVGARLPLEVDVDGPYGTPSGHIFEARVPVLVAAGIGVTPFASILESLLLRARGAGRGGAVAVERVYFVWVTRDQFAFEWFAELLAEVERSEVAGRFEVLIHMTAGRTDVAVEGAALALDLAYARTSADPLTGLRSRTRFGAPDWDALFGSVAARHPGGGAEVFFCGPDGLGRAVAHAAAARGLPYRQEHF